MDFLNAQLQNELFDERPPSSFFDGPQDATVVAVTGRNVYFVIPDFDNDVAFGPAPVDVGSPAKGDQIVVVFVGTGVDKPRVVQLPTLKADDVVFAPAGDLSSTDVQAAIEELDGAVADVATTAAAAYSPSNPPPATVINQTIRGTISLATTDSSKTATISSVDVAKSQLRNLGSSNVDNSTEIAFVRLALTSSTVVTATRGTTGGSGPVVTSYELTEWT